MTWILLIVALALLIASGELLVRGAVSIALKLQISMMVVGLTVVSFATSAPELFVSLLASLKGNSSIALGNVIGSNIANLTIVLGPTALILPLVIQRKTLTQDAPVLLFLSGLCTWFVYTENTLVFWEGMILFFLLLVYLIFLITQARKEKTKVESSGVAYSWALSVLFLILGIAGLKFSSELLIQQVTTLALDLGISDKVIALTMVAFGTSLPELTASIVAALRKNMDLSIGNLIGSNIFNISAVLGITAMITPIPAPNLNLLQYDLALMNAIPLLVVLGIAVSKPHKVGRILGGILLAIYIIYMFWLLT